MSDQPPARIPQPADGHGGLRLLALAAVAAGVLLLAAAAFVLSYAGIHAVALSSGVSPRLARIYPLIFDAMLVVACAAVLSLRGAGLPSRSYAWLSMLALLAAAAAADALHATGTRLPRRPAAAVVAIIPWVLVLIGFGLLLCMLRQARLRRAAASAAAAVKPAAVAEPSGHVAVRHAIDDRPVPRVSPGKTAVQPVSGPAVTAAGRDLRRPAGVAEDLAIDTDPGQDDPARDEAGLADQPDTARAPRARQEQPAGYRARYGDHSASAFSPAPTLALASDAGTEGAPPAPAPGPESDLRADEAGDSYLVPGPDAEPGPDAHASDVEPGPEAEAGNEPEAEAGNEPGAEAEPEDEPVPAAEPMPSAPQFDRMRSSPVPPEA